jgi:hypothetical protein
MISCEGFIDLSEDTMVQMELKVERRVQPGNGAL